MLDPGDKNVVCLVEQIKDDRRDFEFLAQPEIQKLLDRPRRFTELRQADHATAALERMDRTPDGGQQCRLMRPKLQQLEVLVDGGQHLFGFLKKDLENFGVDFLGRRLRQLYRLCGGLRCLCRLWLEGRHRFADLAGRVATGTQRREHLSGLLPELLVADQIGILLQCRETLLDFLAQTSIVWLLFE